MSGRSQVQARLSSVVGDRLLTDEPIGPRTTYRVGGTAAFFVEATTIDEIAEVAAIAAQENTPLVVIGRGSNMLISDDGFEGIALSISAVADSIEIDAEDATCVVGGGVELPRVARQTAAAGLRGFEWAVGVPGSIGGAVRMNAGGHGSDMAQSLIDVDVIDLDDASGAPSLVTMTAADLGLRFRSSDLGPSSVVVRARLRLQHGDAVQSKQLIADIVRWRREHQPGGQNCGSVFVNPVPGTVPAARLIDALGLRGTRRGSASVSDKHANFIQADPGGSAADVIAMIDLVRQRVADGCGIRLRSEVRVVGGTQIVGVQC